MRFEERLEVAASREAVWKLVSDPVSLGGLSDLLSVQELKPGAPAELGTRYRVLLHVGAVPVGGNVEIIQFDELSDVAWSAVSGIDHRLRLKLRPRDDGGTIVILRFAYDSPGMLGVLADVASLVPVRRVFRNLADRLRAELDVPPVDS